MYINDYMLSAQTYNIHRTVSLHKETFNRHLILSHGRVCLQPPPKSTIFSSRANQSKDTTCDRTVFRIRL